MNSEVKEQKKKISVPAFVYAAVALIITLAAVILRTVSLLSFYDADIGYYKSDAVLPVVMNILCLAGTLFFVSAFFVFRKQELPVTGKENNIFVKCASVAAAVGFAGYVIITLIDSNLTALILLALAGALASAVYFLMNLKKQPANRDSQMYAGIGIIVFGIYSLAKSYFDMNVQMNSPNKTALHLACLATLVFFVNEFRALVSDRRKGFYVFSLCAVVLFTGMFSIPPIIADLSGALKNYTYITVNYVFTGVFLYCLVRLAVMAVGLSDKEPDGAGAQSDATIVPEEVSDGQAPEEPKNASDAVAVSETETDAEDNADSGNSGVSDASNVSDDSDVSDASDNSDESDGKDSAEG